MSPAFISALYNCSWLNSRIRLPFHRTLYLPLRASVFTRRKFASPIMARGPSTRGGPRDRGAALESTPLIQPSSLSYREMWAFARPYIFPANWGLRIVAVLSILCVFLRKIISLLPPYALKLSVDVLTADVVNGTAKVPLFALILFMIARLATSFFSGLQDYCYSYVSADNTRRFSVAVFNHLQNLSLAFHLQRRTGEITRVMDRGVSSIDNLTNMFLFTLIPT